MKLSQSSRVPTGRSSGQKIADILINGAVIPIERQAIKQSLSHSIKAGNDPGVQRDMPNTITLFSIVHSML